MGYVVAGPDDLILEGNDLKGFHGRRGPVLFLTADQVLVRLGYSHVRHIYWLVQHGHLSVLKFGRELVFLEQDVAAFEARREQLARSGGFRK